LVHERDEKGEEAGAGFLANELRELKRMGRLARPDFCLRIERICTNLCSLPDSFQFVRFVGKKTQAADLRAFLAAQK
jgi:hypothetical protein